MWIRREQLDGLSGNFLAIQSKTVDLQSQKYMNDKYLPDKFSPNVQFTFFWFSPFHGHASQANN